jgi:Cytochrome c3
MDVGPTWSANRHGQTIRTADPDGAGLAALAASPRFKSLAAKVEFVLGGDKRLRFLKRGEEQGKLDLLPVEWIPPRAGAEGKLTAIESPEWDSQKFGSRCAGCHATGVDSGKKTYSALSLDCFVCHGEVPDKHTTQSSLTILSPHRREAPAAIASICAQCHVRTGTSRHSGLPFADNFVAGDNLFRDFRTDFSEAAIEKLNPADRHVQENIRDVVLLGRESVTCLSCHEVHKQSSKKHHLIADGNICRNCHGAGSKKERVPIEVHSPLCGY